MGTAGWAQAEANSARSRTVLRAPPNWRASAMQGAPAPQTAATNVSPDTVPDVTPPPEGETEMPRLMDRFTDPIKPADDSTQREGYLDAEEVDLAELFR